MRSSSSLNIGLFSVMACGIRVEWVRHCSSAVFKWCKFYELGAWLEEELQIPLDLVPLNPPSRFTRLIEQRGKVLL